MIFILISSVLLCVLSASVAIILSLLKDYQRGTKNTEVHGDYSSWQIKNFFQSNTYRRIIVICFHEIFHIAPPLFHDWMIWKLSLIHISEPTRLLSISYAV